MKPDEVGREAVALPAGRGGGSPESSAGLNLGLDKGMRFHHRDSTLVPLGWRGGLLVVLGLGGVFHFAFLPSGVFPTPRPRPDNRAARVGRAEHGGAVRHLP